MSATDASQIPCEDFLAGVCRNAACRYSHSEALAEIFPDAPVFTNRQRQQRQQSARAAPASSSRSSTVGQKRSRSASASSTTTTTTTSTATTSPKAKAKANIKAVAAPCEEEDVECAICSEYLDRSHMTTPRSKMCRDHNVPLGAAVVLAAASTPPPPATSRSATTSTSRGGRGGRGRGRGRGASSSSPSSAEPSSPSNPALRRLCVRCDCHHVFHLGCLRAWLFNILKNSPFDVCHRMYRGNKLIDVEVRGACPVCRAHMRANEYGVCTDRFAPEAANFRAQMNKYWYTPDDDEDEEEGGDHDDDYNDTDGYSDFDDDDEEEEEDDDGGYEYGRFRRQYF